jgi:hypothetical protein
MSLKKELQRIQRPSIDEVKQIKGFHPTTKADDYEDYVIGFGKYKGTKINDMITIDQLRYVGWFVREKRKELKFKKNRRKDVRYIVFNWWYNKNPKYF